jgi:hypothetical protein
MRSKTFVLCVVAVTSRDAVDKFRQLRGELLLVVSAQCMRPIIISEVQPDAEGNGHVFLGGVECIAKRGKRGLF